MKCFHLLLVLLVFFAVGKGIKDGHYHLSGDFRIKRVEDESGSSSRNEPESESSSTNEPESESSNTNEPESRSSEESFSYYSEERSCAIPVTDQPDFPFILGSGTFLYPEDENDEIIIEEGAEITLACPGNYLINSGQHEKEQTTVECHKHKLEIGGNRVETEALQCAEQPIPIVKYTNNTLCEQNSKQISISYEMNDTSIPITVICFEPEERRSLYALYNISKSIFKHFVFIVKPGYEEGDFYNLTSEVDSLYRVYNQRKAINSLLGLPSRSKQYIKGGRDHLIMGNLAQVQDFMYFCQQKATYQFVNTAPQWRTISEGNWKKLELAIRQLVREKQVDLTVYAGTHETATLPHSETGEATPLYLYTDDETQALPVPRVFWKVLYEPMEKLGIALVVVNNPYLNEIGDSKLCDDVSMNVAWIPEDLKNERNFTHGYWYACTVEELRNADPSVPELDVEDLLI